MIELDKIYNEDCLTGMQRIPDGSVDAVICDLPYEVLNEEWDVIIDPKELYKQYKRICKQDANVLLFCGMKLANILMNTFASQEYCYDLIWCKNNKTRYLSAKVPAAQHEVILYFRLNREYNKDCHKWLRDYFCDELKKSGWDIDDLKREIPNYGADHWFRYSSAFRIPTEQNYRRLQEITNCFLVPYGEIRQRFDDEKSDGFVYNGGLESDLLRYDVPSDRFHPTQKPVSLIRRLVLTYTNEGDTVLDNCSGSGTTAVACVKEKRHFIGFEKDETYWKKSVERVKNEQRQLTIF
jgi:site-specific DNA-methyltransferase (adenine-specific)